MRFMDKRDIEILAILQDDGRTSNAALAKHLHIAEAPAWRRVKALEESGVISGYRAVIDQRKLGLQVTAFVSLRFSSHSPNLQKQFEEQVKQIPEVVWCHNVSGATDFLLCVVARNLNEYGQFVSVRLRTLPGVTAIESSFSLKAVKDDDRLPVDLAID
jgi:Lrp/AsnC family transcriptional regulator, leucine-responsive regulatory protein